MYVTNYEYFSALMSVLLMGSVLGMVIGSWR
jgi:hypothetical protein